MSGPARVWKLGSVPFLNERPLTAALETREDVALEWHPPGPLADLLADGAFDAALIPVAEQLRRGLPAIGAGGIACRGPVDSVRVWHHAPLDTLTRILVPAHSRSSVMLLRLLLPHWGCPDAELVPTRFPPNMSEPPDQPALIFGDAALRCLATGRPSTDLGTAWLELTGLPFVFARWVARPGLDVRSDLEGVLRAGLISAETGLTELAAEAGPERGIPADRALAYLRDSIVYTLDDECEAGQAEFARRAGEAGLLQG